MAQRANPVVRPEAGPAEVERHPEEVVNREPQIWQWLALGGIAVLSVFLNFFQLGQNGFPNAYYAASVRSMLDNWHNFLFVSYDPGGFVSIDKPPLGFWLQVASARAFGFDGFSVLFPQALAGVLAVGLLFHLVRRQFGVGAGLLAALALAVSPVSVVTNRNNTIDSTLALVLLLGAWAVLRAAEIGRLRRLAVAAALVGLGFNVKMLEAYLVVPAFAALYLFAAPISWRRRIGHLAVAGVVLVVVSLVWVSAVDLTPAAQRPYVGSTQDNSELSLALGYNGVDRLMGLFGRGSRATADRVGFTPNPAAAPPAASPSGASRVGFEFPGSGGMFGTGQPGPLRLFQAEMGGQASWLIPLAIFGALAAAWSGRRQFSGPTRNALLLWGSWLLTMGVFFSIAGFIHTYYLTEMAPAVAALVGIGLVALWKEFRSPGWSGWLLPLALAATVAVQLQILASYPTWFQWLGPLVGGLVLISVVAMISARRRQLGSDPIAVARQALAVGVGVGALLIAPTIWAGLPVVQNSTSQLPSAGPALGRDVGRNFAGGPQEAAFAREGSGVDTKLVDYLKANQGDARYLVATTNSMSADPVILATNQPVMALGGFMGADPILTTSKLATDVAAGTVRFFLINAPRSNQFSSTGGGVTGNRSVGRAGGFPGFGGAQNALSNWVVQNCATVPTADWQSTPGGSPTPRGFGAAGQLYDCGRPNAA